MLNLHEKKYKYDIELNNEVDCVYAMAEALRSLIREGFYSKKGQYILSAIKDYIGGEFSSQEFIFYFGEFNSYTSEKDLKKILFNWIDYADSPEMLDMQRQDY